MKTQSITRSAQTRRLTESAMMIALSTVIAFICSLIPVIPFNFPFGGGVTIASMLPIVLIAYFYGTKWGLLTAFSYSVIQMLLGHNTISSLFLPVEEGGMQLYMALLVCLIDYLLAYTALGLGGLFRGKMRPVAALVLGSIVALGVRYACHIVSGAIFYGAWAEWFFEQQGIYELIGKTILESFDGGSLAVIYSIIYNGCYMIPEMIITPLVAMIVLRIPFVRKRELI